MTALRCAACLFGATLLVSVPSTHASTGEKSYTVDLNALSLPFGFVGPRGEYYGLRAELPDGVYPYAGVDLWWVPYPVLDAWGYGGAAGLAYYPRQESNGIPSGLNFRAAPHLMRIGLADSGETDSGLWYGLDLLGGYRWRLGDYSITGEIGVAPGRKMLVSAGNGRIETGGNLVYLLGLRVGFIQ